MYYLDDFENDTRHGLLWKHPEFQQVFRPAVAILKQAEVFTTYSQHWLADENFTTVTGVRQVRARNQTSATYLCRFFRPGQSVPFANEMLVCNVGSISVIPICNVGDGIALNDGPIVPLTMVAEDKGKYLLFNPTEYLKLCGDEMKINIPVTMPPEIVAQGS